MSEPVCAQKAPYALELDDAVKVLHGKSGKPVFFGDTDERTFMKMRDLVTQGRTAEILSL